MYDLVIRFLETNSSNEPQLGHTTRVFGTQEKTGYEGDLDVMNNIYDLEGNNREWTAQAYNPGVRVYRGGSYNSVSSLSYFCPASHRNYDYPYITNSHYTSRLSLYVM